MNFFSNLDERADKIDGAQSGKVERSACPMERAAPRMPLFHCLG